MRILTTLLAISMLLGCKKEESSINACHQQMKVKFEQDLKCTEKDKMEVNLYSGVYEGKTIYFVDTMCPACITVPPQFGYTCDGQKVNISDFNNKITERKEVYNSCTKSFKD